MADGREVFEIVFKVDDSDSKAKTDAAAAGYDKVTAHAARGAKAASDATKKSAEVQFVAIGKVQLAAIHLSDRITAESQKAADAQAKAAKKAADEVARQAKRAGDAAAKEAQKAAEAQAKAAEKWSLASIVQEGAIRGIGSAFEAMGRLGVQAFQATVQAIGDAQKKTDEYAGDLLKTKEQLKELATLRGLVSADDAFVAKIAGFGRATGLSIGQSDEFQRQFYGSIAGGQQKGNIDNDTAASLSIEGGRVASRQTKDFATRGDLLGVLAQFKKYESGTAGVQSALSDAEAIRLGLTEGRGDDAPLTKSLLHVAGSLVKEGGPLPSLAELSALVGVTSLSAGAGQADTRTEQLVRGLRGSDPKQMEFLKQFAGIGENDSLESKLDKIVPKLRAKEASGRDITSFLIESGMNEEQSRAVAEIVPNYEVLKKRFASARNAPSGAAIMAESDKQDASDPLQRSKLAEAALVAEKLKRGEERQNVLPEIKLAEAQLVKDKVDTSYSPGNLLGNFVRSAGSGFQKSGLEVRAEELAVKNLEQRTGKAAPGRGGGLLDAVTAPLDIFTFGNKDSLLSGLKALVGQNSSDINYLKVVEEQQRTTKAVQDQTKVLSGMLGPPTPTVQPGGANAGRVR